MFKEAAQMIKNSDCILIGAGAGLSAAAGLTYSGDRFNNNFKEFIEKYGKENMPDMYSAGFYPFKTQEAKWGYWSKHALMNRFYPEALKLYKDLFDLVKDKDYFVITTNVDHQFFKAGFEENRIFATQGDYGEIQCETGCHDKVYDAEKLFYEMDSERKDCLTPSYLVPKCPVCHGNMAMHLRCDDYFVEDQKWHRAAQEYKNFLNKHHKSRILLLELGVGYNTPGIIRFPFDYLSETYDNFSLIRINMDDASVKDINSIGIQMDINQAINKIMELL
ncbi:MAG: Sir2 silent information regulator family NAD-dependent deacetylase [Erysipelotrichaceae bacterium]